MKRWLIGPFCKRRTFPSNAILVGVDRGAWNIARHGCRMEVAIGDFDSVNAEEMTCIEAHANRVIRLPAQKDETDLEAAIRWTTHPQELWMAYGFLNGPRVDHLFHALLVLHRYEDRSIVLCNANNRIELLTSGVHHLRRSSYRYVSFFCLEPAVITLQQGFRYPLHDAPLDVNQTLGISNELVEPVGEIKLVGKCLMMRSRDDKKKKEA